MFYEIFQTLVFGNGYPSLSFSVQNLNTIIFQETTKQAADDNTTAEKSGTTTPTEKSSETSLAKTSTEKAETPAAKSTTEKAETSPAKITTEKAETRPVKTSPAETLEVRRENSANKENTAKTTLEPTTHAFDGFVPDFEEKSNPFQTF